MAGKLPSALRLAAIILAAVAPLGAVVLMPETPVSEVPLLQEAQLLQDIDAGLLLLVNPRLLEP